MKFKFILLLLLPTICFAGNIDSKNVREGIFKVRGLYGSQNTIVRTNEKQIETLGTSGVVFERDIQWTTDSTFLLFNGSFLKGNDSVIGLTISDTLFNRITEINKFWHKITTIVIGGETRPDVSYFNIDTIQTYKSMDQLNVFKDYTGPIGGGTFVGYNYAVRFQQHSTIKNDYIFVFLEVLTINELSRFRVLDKIYVSLDPEQIITISNCRFNDKYDKEIVALYCSDNAKEDAIISKAWRFNKIKLKIENVPAEQVKFKVADKKIPMWDK